jgi:hypothetical protein
MNFKKTLLATLTTFMVGGVVLSANQNTSLFEPQAALNESDRLWIDVSAVGSKIDKNGGATCLHYFGGSSGTTWPGTTVNWDSANSKVYLDLIIAQGHTTIVVTRGNSTCSSYWGYKTADISISGNTNTRQIRLTSMHEPDTDNYNEIISHVAENFTASTTTSVNNLAGSFDTSGEACSSENAQTAVNTYNGLATFDQNQFDALDVGGGVTGLQRLQYLKDFYSIATALN